MLKVIGAPADSKSKQEIQKKALHNKLIYNKEAFKGHK
jgi:hypothetical protein